MSCPRTDLNACTWTVLASEVNNETDDWCLWVLYGGR